MEKVELSEIEREAIEHVQRVQRRVLLVDFIVDAIMWILVACVGVGGTLLISTMLMQATGQAGAGVTP